MTTETSTAHERDRRGRFDGANCLVTGGASGIGRAIAERLAAEGARVVVADVRPIAEPADGITSVCADITDPAAIEALRADLEVRRGPLEVLVSNAGRGAHERLAEGDPAKWAGLLETNLMGALRVVRAFVPGMLKAGRGDVVFVSSVAAERAYEYGGVYGASKAALERVAETLRLEVRPTLRVITLAPGVVETPFFERSHGAQPDPETIGVGALAPEEIAEAVVYALGRPEEVAVNRLVVRPAGQAL